MTTRSALRAASSHWPALVLALLLSAAASAQQPSTVDPPAHELPAANNPSSNFHPPLPTVSFRYVRNVMAVPTFTLTIAQDGTGVYDAEEALPPSLHPYGVSQTPATRTPIHRTLTVSPATTTTLFAAAQELDYFHAVCASRAKNIADTGTKVLTYSAPGTTGTCTYNYSESKRVVELTGLFQGIAATLDEGRTLAFKLRFDRLALDPEMESFARSVEEGRALEVNTIRPILEKIAADGEVLERVRLRAEKLLQHDPTAK